jgi:hypothetical protein
MEWDTEERGKGVRHGRDEIGVVDRRDGRKRTGGGRE